MCHYICLLSCKPWDVFEIKLLSLCLTPSPSPSSSAAALSAGAWTSSLSTILFGSLSAANTGCWQSEFTPTHFTPRHSLAALWLFISLCVSLCMYARLVTTDCRAVCPGSASSSSTTLIWAGTSSITQCWRGRGSSSRASCSRGVHEWSHHSKVSHNSSTAGCTTARTDITWFKLEIARLFVWKATPEFYTFKNIGLKIK